MSSLVYQIILPLVHHNSSELWFSREIIYDTLLYDKCKNNWGTYTDKNHKKIWRKRQKIFPNFLKMRIFCQKYSHLGESFLFFFIKCSHDFCQCSISRLVHNDVSQTISRQIHDNFFLCSSWGYYFYLYIIMQQDNRSYAQIIILDTTSPRFRHSVNSSTKHVSHSSLLNDSIKDNVKCMSPLPWWGCL